MSSGLMVLLFVAGLILAARVFLPAEIKVPVLPIGDPTLGFTDPSRVDPGRVWPDGTPGEQAARRAAMFDHPTADH